MPAPDSPAPPRSSRLRLFRRVFGALLATGCLLVLAVFAYDYLVHPTPRSAPSPLRALLALGLLAGPACLLYTRLRPARHRAAPWLAFAASLALFGIWVTRDDATLVHDLDDPRLRSDFPEAAATHALTLRYSRHAPDSLHDTVPHLSLRFPTLSSQASDRENWQTFLSTHGETLRSHWEELAPLRVWIDELAAAPRLGDLAENFSDPLPDTRALRAVARAAAAHASLLALEGRRDEAVEILLPVLITGDRLEADARTLVRRMTAILLHSQTLSALTFVLDQGPLEDDTTRARLAAALAPHQDAAEGARLLLLCEYALTARVLTAYGQRSLSSRDLGLSDHELPFRPLFNPKATINQLGDLLHALAEAAARRDLETIDQAGEAVTSNPPLMLGKNMVGRVLIGLGLPGYNSLAKRYWETHDTRVALLARLTHP